MPLSVTKNELTNLVGGKTSKNLLDTRFSGVHFDSRLISEGELFVALKGDTGRHGHEFLDRANEKGSSLFLVEDEALLRSSPLKDRLVLVADSLKALQGLAQYWRRQIELPTVAITGSVGKTTVKEMVRSVLKRHSPGIASEKSFNNHLGVPMTICRSDASHSWVVLEMGMNHPGELTELSQIASPDVAVITKIAPAHMFSFRNLSEVAIAKCEIFTGLKSGGKVVLNADDDLLLRTARETLRSEENWITFGHSEDADVRVSSFRPIPFRGSEVELQVFGEQFAFTLPVVGSHSVLNAAAAVAACVALIPELPYDSIREGLSTFSNPPMRLNIVKLHSGGVLVDDSYNANPESMKALIDLAKGNVKAGDCFGFILGDMLELGDGAENYHKELAQSVCEVRPDFVVAVGEYAPVFLRVAKERAKGMEDRVWVVGSVEQAKEVVSGLLKQFPSPAIFVKGSRSIGLDRIATWLRNSEG